MASSALTTESALYQHSPKNTGVAVFDPHLREAIYEKSPLSGRPLSYAELLRRWAIAVTKRLEADCPTDDAEEEYEDSASDIITVVGAERYKRLLEILMAALERHWSDGDVGVERQESALN
ncbi:hypothetical protein HD554DRAFT_2042495 [Boletus coccyginus]|nr:hypothetical protein HD554DRAFT_2042495 [Boletus coccyginus]